MVQTPTYYAQRAYNELVKHGKQTTIIEYVDSYDESSGVNTRTATSHAVQTSPFLEYESQYIDGVLIQRGDAMMIVSAYGLTFDLALGQQVDTSWWVVGIKPYDYQDETVAYELQLRRA